MSAIFPQHRCLIENGGQSFGPIHQHCCGRWGVRSGITLLDLCCGDGYFTAPLAEIVNGRVYALDLDPAMTDMAREEVSRQRVSVLQWFNADARDVAGILPEQVDSPIRSTGCLTTQGLSGPLPRRSRPAAFLPSSTGIRYHESKRRCSARRAGREPKCACHLKL
jgi:SAM-dependent methyltransferase